VNYHQRAELRGGLGGIGGRVMAGVGQRDSFDDGGVGALSSELRHGGDGWCAAQRWSEQ
jgi:uncharacterized protein YidB (DUF937 family)